MMLVVLNSHNETKTVCLQHQLQQSACTTTFVSVLTRRSGSSGGGGGGGTIDAWDTPGFMEGTLPNVDLYSLPRGLSSAVRGGARGTGDVRIAFVKAALRNASLDARNSLLYSLPRELSSAEGGGALWGYRNSP